MHGTFEELVAPLMDELRRSARRKVRTEVHGEDLLQDALVKGYRLFHTYNQGTNFRAWMHRILRTTWIDNWRRTESRVKEVYDENMPDYDVSEISAENSLMDTIIDQRLLSAMADLPEGMRDVLISIALDDLSYAETAERLNIPIGTVMSRYNRARKKVAAALAISGDPRFVYATVDN